MRVGTGFVGRHDILEKIGRWCDGEVERPLIVTGPPGSGKTTLVKRLDEITRGLAQGLPDLGVGTFTFIHYCKANDDRSLDPIRFVEKLAQALTDRFPTFADAIFSDVPEIELNITQHIGSAVDSTVRSLEISHLALGERSHRVAYDRAVRRPLERMRLDGVTEPVHIAIDALDEALTFDRQRHLVDLLRHALETAASPSENLRFLLTTRRGERRVQETLSGEEIDLVADLDAGDVDEYIRAGVVRGTDGADPARTARLVAAIREASRGNFLFAYHAIASLDRYTASDYRLPTGLGGLYADFLKRELRPDPLDEVWSDQHWPILSTLAVARGRGLTPDQLSGTTRLPPSRIRQTLDICGQFLSSEGRHGPVDFYHPSFREFLLEDEDLGIADQRPDRRLAEFLQADYDSAPDEPSSRYAIEHLQRHLVRAVACETVASEKAICRGRLRSVVDDPGLLERKAALVGVDAVVADMVFALKQDETLTSQVNALDRAAGHLRSWRPDVDPQLFARQVLDAAKQTGADSLAANTHDMLVRRGTPFLARRWDSQQDSTELVRRLIGHRWGVAALSALPGDRLASASYDDTVRIWSYRDGSVLKVIPLERAKNYARYTAPIIVATPRGKLAVRALGELLLVDPDLGRIERQAGGIGDGPLAALPSGSLIGAVGNKILAWSSEDLEPLPLTYSGHEGKVVALSASPDGTVYSAEESGEIHGWDPTDPTGGKQVTATSDSITALAGSEQFLAVGCGNGKLHLVDMRSGGSRAHSEHRGAIRALLFLPSSPGSAADPGSLLASASDDTTIRIWDPRSAACTRTLVGHEGWVQALADLGEGMLASAESQDVVHIWDLGTMSEAPAATPGGAVRSLTITQRRAVAGHEDGSLRIWHVDTGQFDMELVGHDGPVRGVVIAGDGRLVSAGEDGKLLVRAQPTGHLERTIDLEEGILTHLVAAADGRVVVASGNGVQLIDIENDKITREPGFPPVSGLAASSGGWIAVGEGRGRQNLYNVRTGERRFMRRGSDGFELNSVHTLAIAGERYLISDGRSFEDPVGTLLVYEIDTGELLTILSTHPSDVYALAADPHNRLWSTCRDRSIRVTGLETGHVLARLALDRTPRFLALVDGGRGVIIGDMAGRLSRFDYVVPPA